MHSKLGLSLSFSSHLGCCCHPVTCWSTVACRTSRSAK